MSRMRMENASRLPYAFDAVVVDLARGITACGACPLKQRRHISQTHLAAVFGCSVTGNFLPALLRCAVRVERRRHIPQTHLTAVLGCRVGMQTNSDVGFHDFLPGSTHHS